VVLVSRSRRGREWLAVKPPPRADGEFPGWSRRAWLIWLAIYVAAAAYFFTHAH